MIGPAVPEKPARQASRILDVPSAVAERPVGGVGVRPSVVALATAEGVPAPSELIAETR